MLTKDRVRGWSAALITLFAANWIALFGGVLSAVSALLIIGLLILGFLPIGESPYIGIMGLLIMPAVFVFGLLLVPAGALWERRRQRRRGQTAPPDHARPFPTFDLNDSGTRRVFAWVGVLTAFNLLLISTVTYKGVEFMDSVTFCGQVCHTVMEPEHTAYLGSPHARVGCVECHIGPGAPWFVRSKLSGIRQVFAVLSHSYSTPIPAPVENLRPSRDTCERCHWPQKFSGDRVRVITRFQEDEQNTPLKTVLLMHIGGGASTKHGIHSWHIDPTKRTFYSTTDEQRQEISSVRVERADGSTLHFARPDSGDPPKESYAEREMDCIDCHNRPTHIFSLPGPAMDLAMADGRIAPSIPFIKKMGVEALESAVESDDGGAHIEKTLREYYSTEHPDAYATDRAAVDRAIEELQAIFARNVFPDMEVTWGTYKDNIGHQAAPGCFRCHDDSLATEDGEAISQDCNLCHTVLAWDEEDPEILGQLEIR